MTDPNDLRPRALPVDPAPGPGRQASLAVVTIVHGRHEHLERQLWGLRQQHRRPDMHVVVAMDDSRVGDVARGHAGDWDVQVASMRQSQRPPPPGRRPQPRRRRGRCDRRRPGRAARRRLHPFGRAARAVCRRARLRGEPRPGRAARRRRRRPGGPCRRGGLPPPAPARSRLPRPRAGSPDRARSTAPGASRPDRRRGAHGRGPAPLLVAVLRAHRALLAGHRGLRRGLRRLRRRGHRLRATGRRCRRTAPVGGRRLAHHQHHPTASPPVQHVHDIVANANRFAETLGLVAHGGMARGVRRTGTRASVCRRQLADDRRRVRGRGRVSGRRPPC